MRLFIGFLTVCAILITNAATEESKNITHILIALPMAFFTGYGVAAFFKDNKLKP